MTHDSGAAPRCAVYARYSSKQQLARSIGDQVDACRERIRAEGWAEGPVYSDSEATGATTVGRPGLAAMLEAAESHEFEVVLTEALDRLARNQADVARIWQTLEWFRVRLVTLAEGEVAEFQVGMAGTMAAVYLRDLAQKTRRGQRARARQGLAMGAPPYGLAADPVLDASGTVVRGRRKLVPKQVAVVQRIFREYAAGASMAEIAAGLGNDGIPAPQGGAVWDAKTLSTNKLRGGILHNRAYLGEHVYGRTVTVRDPRTGGTRHVWQPESEHIVVASGVEAIIDRELWNAVQIRREREYLRWCGRGSRRRHALTGAVRCSGCGSAMVQLGAGQFYCPVRRGKVEGQCLRSRRVSRVRLEEEVVGGLLVALARVDWVAEFARLRGSIRSTQAALQEQLEEVTRKQERLMAVVEDGVRSESVYQRIRERDNERRDLAQEMQRHETLPSALPDDIEERVDGIVRAHGVALMDCVDEAGRVRALQRLAALVEKVIVRPVPRAARDVSLEWHPDLRACLMAALDEPGNQR